ncbi:MAG: NADH-quinone oxidoreductase subunit NuoD [Chloroflexi bacterium]|nr:NADH-quinone oxidoreductase subunit NuoD [Chloroflexota bacterium]MBT17873.1 NADH-quinone oxidoreductase subunit NuoD [Dehalococcoidia bacterium]|tara:strand:- start:8356 stop:9462 length:1107 start_codon:yes stop_codon:yes gene_type:complete
MSLHTEPVVVNIGPHHPSTHGVFRMRVTFDGENVQDVEPVIGYLHRGTEKLAEERQYSQVITLTDRLDYVASMTNNQAYVLSCEKLIDIEVPDRGKYLRTIAAELQRVASHLVGVGFFLAELGGFGGTALMYCFRERERILDMFEMLCGARITVSFMRIGGVFQDAPEEFWPALRKFLDEMPGYADELNKLIFESEIVQARTKNVSVISADQAIDASLTGPILRASGVPWDIRAAQPYDAYDQVKFDVITAQGGDNFDRFWVRMLEVEQSLKIIEQCYRDIRSGPVRSTTSLLFRPSPGEAYVPIEAPKGELGFYLVSDGSIAPYRCKIRSPSFISLTLFKEMLVGWKLADIIVSLGSLDFNMGEVDR